MYGARMYVVVFMVHACMRKYVCASMYRESGHARDEGMRSLGILITNPYDFMDSLGLVITSPMPPSMK